MNYCVYVYTHTYMYIGYILPFINSTLMMLTEMYGTSSLSSTMAQNLYVANYWFTILAVLTIEAYGEFF
jgi:hypothetical protein